MSGVDWSFLGSEPGPSQPLQGIVPVTVTPPVMPSIVTVPPQDQSATRVPLSAYASPPALRDPNASLPPPAGAPDARAISNALEAAGYFPQGAASFAKIIAGAGPSIDALEKTTPFFTVPLAIGSGVAGGVADTQNRTPPVDAWVGNAIRGALVVGAGAAGTAMTPEIGGAGGMLAGYEADKHLPPAPQIGHAVVQGILNLPVPNLYPSYDPIALEAFGE